MTEGNLTPEEAEVARRYFAGEVGIERLAPVLDAHLQRLIDAGVVTIPRVPRARGILTDDQLRRLARAAEKREKADAEYRAEVLDVMAAGASFSEVAKATGLSTNTLQRWKKEAAD